MEDIGEAVTDRRGSARDLLLRGHPAGTRPRAEPPELRISGPPSLPLQQELAADSVGVESAQGSDHRCLLSVSEGARCQETTKLKVTSCDDDGYYSFLNGHAALILCYSLLCEEIQL